MVLIEKRRRKLFEQGGYYHIFQDKGFNGFVKMHSHTFYQFSIIEQGCISWRYDGETHRQHQGDILFSPPGEEHSLFVIDNNTVYYTLSFSEEILEAAFGSELFASGDALEHTLMLTLQEEDRERLLKLLDVMMCDPEHSRAGTFRPGCHLCIAAVRAFLGIVEREVPDASSIQVLLRHSQDPIAAVQSYIDLHYCEDLLVEQLIEMSRFTKTTFFSCFREATGATPKQYITEKRMYKAVQLIQDTDLPFCQIAEEVGYHDFSTFFKNFCRMSSCSPTEYREKFRQSQLELGL